MGGRQWHLELEFPAISTLKLQLKTLILIQATLTSGLIQKAIPLKTSPIIKLTTAESKIFQKVTLKNVTDQQQSQVPWNHLQHFSQASGRKDNRRNEVVLCKERP